MAFLGAAADLWPDVELTAHYRSGFWHCRPAPRSATASCLAQPHPASSCLSAQLCIVRLAERHVRPRRPQHMGTNVTTTASLARRGGGVSAATSRPALDSLRLSDKLVCRGSGGCFSPPVCRARASPSSRTDARALFPSPPFRCPFAPWARTNRRRRRGTGRAFRTRRLAVARSEVAIVGGAAHPFPPAHRIPYGIFIRPPI
jgi:hypothetical protein